jgi:hypothetical protein
MIVVNECSQILKAPEQTDKPSADGDRPGSQEGHERPKDLGGKCGKEIRHFAMLPVAGLSIGEWCQASTCEGFLWQLGARAEFNDHLRGVRGLLAGANARCQVGRFKSALCANAESTVFLQM